MRKQLAALKQEQPQVYPREDTEVKQQLNKVQVEGHAWKSLSDTFDKGDDRSKGTPRVCECVCSLISKL